MEPLDTVLRNAEDPGVDGVIDGGGNRAGDHDDPSVGGCQRPSACVVVLLQPASQFRVVLPQDWWSVSHDGGGA